jgi:peptidoglycan-associated lipoprotein
MTTGAIAHRRIGIGLLLVAIGIALSCSESRRVSSSGDSSFEQQSGPPVAQVEPIKPDPIATVPAEKPTSIETARIPLTPSSPATSELAPPVFPPTATPAPIEEIAPPVVPPPVLAPVEPIVTDFLADIYFDVDRYVIKEEFQTVMAANAEWIKNTPGKTLVIEGHCDERGTLTYNLILGEKRALSAKHYLEDLGVPASRLKTVSYGEVRPVCKQHEERCWKMNRRIHFVPE